MAQAVTSSPTRCFDRVESGAGHEGRVGGWCSGLLWWESLFCWQISRLWWLGDRFVCWRVAVMH
ncbi:hypothetical protein JCM18909_4001 [Cutibacterium acnes JCM 18909]|nr:hypothetical protein JCM18909_4001 [Cutibacterium acnes JCM 18909]